MGKRYKALFGSGRARFLIEPRRRRNPLVHRSQKIRFRRRAARSLLRKLGLSVWTLVQVAVVIGLAGWGLYEARDVWKKSEWVRVQNVSYEGDIPGPLPALLGIKPGQNLLLINLTRKEADALKKFPELKRIRISRTLGRGVLVKGIGRSPVAFADSSGSRPMGVDESGIVFPIWRRPEPTDPLPRLSASHFDDRKKSVQCLLEWKKSAPNFYSLVKNLETDRMHAFHVELSNGVKVQWGDLDLEHVEIRARHILSLMESFVPRKTPAQLRFITDDRIVMDANWVRAEPK